MKRSGLCHRSTKNMLVGNGVSRAWGAWGTQARQGPWVLLAPGLSLHCHLQGGQDAGAAPCAPAQRWTRVLLPSVCPPLPGAQSRLRASGHTRDPVGHGMAPGPHGSCRPKVWYSKFLLTYMAGWLRPQARRAAGVRVCPGLLRVPTRFLTCSHSPSSHPGRGPGLLLTVGQRHPLWSSRLQGSRVGFGGIHAEERATAIVSSCARCAPLGFALRAGTWARSTDEDN